MSGNEPHRYSAKKKQVASRYDRAGGYVVSPRPVERSHAKGLGAGDGLSPKAMRVILGAAAAFVLVGVMVWGYTNFLRSVPVTVNGKEVSVRVGSSVEDLLKKNRYFDVAPGNLLSVSGKVLKEAEGSRCTVARIEGENAVSISSKQLAATKVSDNESYVVTNGADVTEKHEEQITEITPGVQMEQGGAIQFVKQWGRSGKRAVWVGALSGETVDKGVVEEPSDFVIGSANVKPKGKKKYMALTFDDGPSQYTQQILDILKERGAKATFFNLGKGAANNPKQSKAVLDAGCELASHTYAHANLPKLSAEELRAEISFGFDAIEKATSTRPQMIRAPYGAFTVKEWQRAGDLISCNVLWNIDTRDWERPGAKAITSNVLNHAHNGAIALMHDGGGNREQDIEALPDIIDGLHEAGYELITVSELMARDDTFPKAVVTGKVSMPKDAILPPA